MEFNKDMKIIMKNYINDGCHLDKKYESLLYDSILHCRDKLDMSVFADILLLCDNNDEITSKYLAIVLTSIANLKEKDHKYQNLDNSIVVLSKEHFKLIDKGYKVAMKYNNKRNKLHVVFLSIIIIIFMYFLYINGMQYLEIVKYAFGLILIDISCFLIFKGRLYNRMDAKLYREKVNKELLNFTEYYLTIENKDR